MNKIIVAHRGGKEFEHENTLEAFKKAVKIGAKMCELDIRQTKDGKIVCFHNPEVQKKLISELTYAELLHLSGVKVPLFKDVLDEIKGKLSLLCEIKEAGYEKEALKLLQSHFILENVTIISFEIEILAKVRQLNESIDVGLIIGSKNIRKMLNSFKALTTIKKYKIGTLIMNFHLITFGFAFIAHMFGLKVFTWTINDPEKLFKFNKNKNVTGIITDIPEKTMKLISTGSDF